MKKIRTKNRKLMHKPINHINEYTNSKKEIADEIFNLVMVNTVTNFFNEIKKSTNEKKSKKLKRALNFDIMTSDILKTEGDKFQEKYENSIILEVGPHS